MLNFLLNWSPVISGVGSLILSTALVWLYYQQKELDKKRINREVRSKHTEILRERVELWLGESQSRSGEEYSNLPQVKGAKIDPAPAKHNIAFEEQFRVVPEMIEKDRYLEDLLDNHAEDLKVLKEGIEQKYEIFKSLKNEFMDLHEGGEVLERDMYVIRPTDAFNEWIFGRAVLLYRDTYYGKEELKEIVDDGVENTPHGYGDTIMYSGSSSAASPRKFAYEAEVDDIKWYNENKEELSDKIKELFYVSIDGLDAMEEFKLAKEAAEVLDEMQKDIEELKHTLVEYEGKPFFKGDCHYLQEAEVK